MATEQSKQNQGSQTCTAMEVGQEKVKTLGLLDLPSEIRNKIYRLVLIRDSGPDVPSHQRLIRSLAPPALTLANKQILTEALPIYYAENLFYILLCGEKTNGSDRDTSHFNRFIGMMEYFGRRVTSSIGQEPLQSIQNLIIQIHTVEHHLEFSADEQFSFVQPAEYCSVLALSGLSRITMTFESGDGENKPFDCTRYRWTVKAATDSDEHVMSAVEMLFEHIFHADYGPGDWYAKSIMQVISRMYDDGRDSDYTTGQGKYSQVVTMWLVCFQWIISQEQTLCRFKHRFPCLAKDSHIRLEGVWNDLFPSTETAAQISTRAPPW